MHRLDYPGMPWKGYENGHSAKTFEPPYIKPTAPFRKKHTRLACLFVRLPRYYETTAPIRGRRVDRYAHPPYAGTFFICWGDEILNMIVRMDHILAWSFQPWAAPMRVMMALAIAQDMTWVTKRRI